jgi:hypothetical protein
MREIKTIDANKWLSLINSEANPNIDYFNIDYIELDKQYAVVLDSGYGLFVSKLVKNKDQLPELEKQLQEKYDVMKKASNAFNPKIGSSLVK